MPFQIGTKSRSTIKLKPEVRDNPVRRLGLGQSGLSDSTVLAIMQDAMSCSMGTVPQVEETTWDIAGPLNDAALSESFGSTIDIFGGGTQVNGVATVQSSFPRPGVLQTGLIVTGYGFHVIAEPNCFTAQGNALSPPPAAAIAGPISPDVFTQADTAAELGLAAGQTLQKATLSWGWPMQYAAWYLAQGYEFTWTVKNRYNIVTEAARDVAWFSSGETSGTGTSQVDVAEFAARVNAYYRDSCCAPTNAIFLPVTHRRQGAFLQGGVESSVWRPTNDYGLVNARQGGLALQQRFNNAPFVKLPLPYFICANSPIVFQLNQIDEVLGNLFRQQLSITDATGLGIAPPVIGPDANIINGFGFAANELTLDAVPVTAPSANQAGTARFKGGNLLLSMIIKGFEVTDDFACALQQPAIRAALANEYGLQSP